MAFTLIEVNDKMQKEWQWILRILIKKSLICEKEEKMKVLNFKTKSFRKIPNPFYNLDNYMDNLEMNIKVLDLCTTGGIIGESGVVEDGKYYNIFN